MTLTLDERRIKLTVRDRKDREPFRIVLSYGDVQGEGEGATWDLAMAEARSRLEVRVAAAAER